MKNTKDRLHRVIVIGATPAGIAATNKLGELGIPVILVDADSNLDEKLSREEWRLPSGVPLNFAHRSGLLRILRNPVIRCILPAEVTALRHSAEGFRVHIKRTRSYVDPERCILCGRCKEICPVISPNGEHPIRFNGRRSLPGRPVIDKRRIPLCQDNCPLGVNAQAYIALARAGKYREALEVIRRDNVLPGICGRVCTHPCEKACRRGEIDDPIAIRDIKRFISDFELSGPHQAAIQTSSERSERIAVIGSGPAGLAAAADLARLGYPVTVFEKEALAGGLLRYGIGRHRLPRNILDHELRYIEKLGVQFKTSHPVDLPGDISTLQKDFDAVIMATGAWADRMLGVPGEDLQGVEGCLSFLTRLYRNGVKRIEGKVAVIGDGNAAFDLARAIRRLGAPVTILSWFPKDLIPADKDEIRGAEDEGITIKDRTQVIAFSGRGGRLESLECKPTEPGDPDAQGIPWPVLIPEGEPFHLKFDQAVIAIGQKGLYQHSAVSSSINVNDSGFIEVDALWRSSKPALYAAGDAVTGPSSVVEAMATGRAVARSVHRSFAQKEAFEDHGSRPREAPYPEVPSDLPSRRRVSMPEVEPAARWDDFKEVALGLSEAQVLSESERCLQCGLCSECLLCIDACGPIAAINHKEGGWESIEHAGVLIIADPAAAPTVRGEDVIRAYGPKAAKSDVHAMMTRGFAAAARAMTLLEGTSERQRGHGMSFSPPGPELSPEIRVGVFTCRCNDAFGWMDDMDRYVESLVGKESIIHAEVLNSACVPEGSAHILRAIRDKGITRVALASCVCCPLDFVCSACTDQRSRLKEALFKGTGVSRSMVETCNLRGEALRFIHDDPSTALSRFKGLIDRSVHRAKRLKALPSPMRTYNFTTAVIGNSQAAVDSAQTLAEAGFEVFMFNTADEEQSGRPSHPNIHHFGNGMLKGLSGTLGNFQIYFVTEGFTQIIQVGAVILGEKSRRFIPYIHQEGLPGRFVTASMQKMGVLGVPYVLPGATSISGLFLASPPGIQVSEKRKGSAAAVMAAAIMPRGPRQNKGYTVVVDENRCRGCGRCIKVCPYQAITLQRNDVEAWSARVDETLCKGCGNCISVCPSNAADSPYRNQVYLEQLLEEVLVQ